MDSFELNKILGGVVGALLVFTGANFLSDAVYGLGESGHKDGEHHYAYAAEIDDGSAPAEEAAPVDVAALVAAADAGKGARVFGKCKACHKVEAGANGTGPTLFHVIGRPVGAEAGYSYSSAMAEHGGTWTEEELFHFLEAPKKFVPGTKMSFAGLRKESDRANLIAYLETLK